MSHVATDTQVYVFWLAPMCLPVGIDVGAELLGHEAGIRSALIDTGKRYSMGFDRFTLLAAVSEVLVSAPASAWYGPSFSF